MPHNNIAVFIPHLGCPHTCSFCNQRYISGAQKAVTVKEVIETCEKAYSEISDRSETEIAFFGGSFTAIPRDYMIELLQAVQRFLGKDGFKGIRISTRPDCIDEEILSVLKKYKITAIELGAQSMCDDVLYANERGHSAEDIKKASYLIKEYGFELGLQMMVGLYKSTPQKDIFTADEIISLNPKTVRIYPVVILEGTILAEKFRSGEYLPFDFDLSVSLSAEILEKFISSGINVIKLGLHSSETVESEFVGGLYHPAYRELCEGELFRNRIENLLLNKKGNFIVYVNPKAISKAIGQKRKNIEYFKNKGINLKIKPCIELEGYDINVTEEV